MYSNIKNLLDLTSSFLTVFDLHQYKKYIKIIENVQRMASNLILTGSRLSYQDQFARHTLSHRNDMCDMIKVLKLTFNIYDPKVNCLHIDSIWLLQVQR